MVPAALAAKRATEVAKIPFDTEAYRRIASLEELDAVLAAAREEGILGSTPRPTRSTRTGPISSASRWRSRRARPAMCRCCTATRPISSAAARAGADPGQRRDRRGQAAAGGPLRPQDRPEHEVRLDGDEAPRHRRRALRRHDADFLRARCRARPATAWTSSRAAISATRRSPSWMSPAPARRRRLRPGARSTRRRPMRPRMPT